ncbi:glycosyltransferase [Microbacterium sp. ARD31]|uniref:glycosyltransferase n=1 Tax=Microbacterium sp. ARD31 TaxID=2962576 RepID=UPI002882122E|nr:glycosyltransferase [Microbacterium sp. ARD31]MDT0182965.1 glycosyltransferase [Microbacterium sp. ARD31]
MPSVAIIGTRGYPSYYGGFETAVRKLAPYLCDAGWDVTVYGRPGTTRGDDKDRDPRVDAVETWGIESKSLSTLSYGYFATRDAIRRRVDVALVMNVANGYWLPMLKRAGIPTLVNVDGIEWDRDKWNGLAKRAFIQGAKLTAKYASELVFDAEAIGARWRKDLGRDGVFLPYGGEAGEPLEVPLNLERRKYVLVVARFVPENSISAFFDAVPRIQQEAPVIIVGSTGYGGDLDDRAAELDRTYDRVQWLGHVSNDSLLSALWQNAGVYFHGHSVGGTNPALVQAMASGAPVVARDTVYNAEVLGDSSQLSAPSSSDIASSIITLLGNPERQDECSRRNRLRARSRYSWDEICSGYEKNLRAIMPADAPVPIRSRA